MVLGGLPDPADLAKVILVAAFGQAVIAAGPKAGAFIGAVAKACGGGCGGRPNLAQAGGVMAPPSMGPWSRPRPSSWRSWVEPDSAKLLPERTEAR